MLPVAPRARWLMRSEPGSVRCGWPTNSSSDCGRRRSARGAADWRRDDAVTRGRLKGTALAGGSSASERLRACLDEEEGA